MNRPRTLRREWNNISYAIGALSPQRVQSIDAKCDKLLSAAWAPLFTKYYLILSRFRPLNYEVFVPLTDPHISLVEM